MPPIKVTFVEERETKNTIMFMEDNDDPVIGRLYIQKSAIEKIGFKGTTGRTIEVTIGAKAKR